MQRRDFLRLLISAPFALNTSDLWAQRQLHWNRRLILIELKGGNDGLNTVVPFNDPHYYKLRPNLAINRDEVIQLSESTGLHPSLKDLMPIWDKQQLAIVQGLGYENPNLSHFRSGDIWHTGSDSHIILEDGWLARLFKDQPPPNSFTADGIVIGDDIGPLIGQSIRTLVMKNPQQFIRQAQRINNIQSTSSNEALRHILKMQQGVFDSAKNLEAKIGMSKPQHENFPRSNIGRKMAMAAQLINNGIDTAVIKLSHGSFDTHTNQKGRHKNLLKQLAEALSAFERSMQKSGQWDKVLVMTYSEFGRRAAENGSRGTDHGTAAAHIMLGGQVKGGLYGQQPSLTRLENQNLRYTMDFRHLYATAAKWWGGNINSNPFEKYQALDII